MKMVDQLRSYRNGVHGEFFVSVADQLEELESENENLHIENDTLCSRVQNEQPGSCTACRPPESEGEMSKDLLFDIALEGHTMGRLYTRAGEPEGPMDFAINLKRWWRRRSRHLRKRKPSRSKGATLKATQPRLLKNLREYCLRLRISKTRSHHSQIRDEKHTGLTFSNQGDIALDLTGRMIYLVS